MAYAVITGASKGIGKSVAEQLASRGYDLLLTAQSADELKAVSQHIETKFKVTVYYLAIDLSKPDHPNQLFDWCISHHVDVTILVNNAGYGLGGAFHTHIAEDYLAMMQVNMSTPVLLTSLFIRQFKTSPEFYILNIASSAAYQAIPLMSVYAASKVFMLRFSRGLHRELKGSNFSVTCVSPGPTATNFADRARLGDKAKKMAQKVNMSPDVVAKIAIDAMFSKKAEIIPGFLNKLGAFFAKVLPHSIVEKAAMGVYVD